MFDGSDSEETASALLAGSTSRSITLIALQPGGGACLRRFAGGNLLRHTDCIIVLDGLLDLDSFGEEFIRQQIHKGYVCQQSDEEPAAGLSVQLIRYSKYPFVDWFELILVLYCRLLSEGSIEEVLWSRLAGLVGLSGASTVSNDRIGERDYELPKMNSIEKFRLQLPEENFAGPAMNWRLCRAEGSQAVESMLRLVAGRFLCMLAVQEPEKDVSCASSEELLKLYLFVGPLSEREMTTLCLEHSIDVTSTKLWTSCLPTGSNLLLF